MRKLIAILWTIFIGLTICFGQVQNDTIDGQIVYPFADKTLDKLPEFPGGNAMMMSFIRKNLIIQKEQEDWQGSIYISFIVDTTGQVRNAYIYKRYFKGALTPIENEALRVVNIMPIWSVGQKKGKKVPVQITLPIKFGLKE